jgi:Zn-dependent protease
MSFYLFGIPVRLKSSFFLMALVLGSSLGMTIELAIWVVVVLFSILLHELGHAFAMRFFGYSPSIELCHTGGLTSWGESQRTSLPFEQTIVSLAGPISGFIVSGFVWMTRSLFLSLPGSYGHTLLQHLLWINFGWGVLNLLPMLPLDGGGVMKAVLQAVTHSQSNVLAYIISICVSLTAAVLAVSVHWNWAAFIAAYCGLISYQYLQSENYQKKDEVLRPQLTALWRDLLAGEAEKVVKACDELLTLAKSDLFRASIVELATWGYLRMEKIERAYEMINSMPESYQPSARLKGTLLLRAGYAREAMPYLQKAFQKNANGFTLFTLSEAFFEIGDYSNAVSIILDNRSCQSLDPSYVQYIANKLFFVAHFHDAMKLYEFSFELFHCASDAYNVACSLSRLNRLEEALVWVHTAIKAGYSDLTHLENDEDLESVRSLPGYTDICTILEKIHRDNEII